MKLSFRRHKRETGLSSLGYPYRVVDIKMDGKVVGQITPPNWKSKSDEWYVQIAIIKEDINEDGNPNCNWRWATMAPRFFNEEDARDYLKTHKSAIEKMNLHYLDSHGA